MAEMAYLVPERRPPPSHSHQQICLCAHLLHPFMSSLFSLCPFLGLPLRFLKRGTMPVGMGKLLEHSEWVGRRRVE